MATSPFPTRSVFGDNPSMPLRDDFTQSVKRTLAHRVALHCSNPDCRAKTMGPQSDPTKAVNLGVAAHITAAARGGPRFDVGLTDKQRRNPANGIWLCQNCAKLIDSDTVRYSVAVLQGWKARAEEEAQTQLGKSSNRAGRSYESAVAALKRDRATKDALTRELLKPVGERWNLPRNSSRASKFARSELIIRRIDDTSYPDIDDSPGISGWFKVEVLDFYYGGIDVILDLHPALFDVESKKWCVLTHEQSKSSYPLRFFQHKVFLTGRIPWRNILHYEMNGDKIYPQPHVYCAFADNGMPYEGWGYFTVEDGYEWELRADDKVELETLLMQPEVPGGGASPLVV